jgi:SAM-dependent methyltransferase
MTSESKQPEAADDQQTKLWNGPAGRAWIDLQEGLDQAFLPFEDLLADEVSALSARSVLDVGCGTGSTTLAVARRLGPNGRSVGIDLSEPMITFARARAEREGTPASFMSANAQTHTFEPGGFDLCISRFGVMFFDDPVRAFTNLRHATRAGGALRFITWRPANENPFMTTAERTTAPLLPDLPARRPDAPGQFAFADPARVQAIVGASGWQEIDIQKVDRACAFPETYLLPYLTRLGPVGLALQQADDRTRTQVVDTLRAAFTGHVHDGTVRFTAACWLVAARSP